MRKALIIAAFLATFNGLVLAQERTPPAFFAVTTKDRVYILLGRVPDGSEGFNLYRKAREDEEFTRLTDKPIKPVRDPIAFRSIIGEDYEWVREATRGETEFQVLRRILRDRGMQIAFSFASLKLAEALGRLYVDKEVEFGREYIYKVAFVNYRDEEFEVVEKSCVVKEAKKPEPPFEVKTRAGDSQIKVEWKYYELPEVFEYTAVGFNIYRRAEDEEEFKRINEVLILWQKDMTYRIDYDVLNGRRYTYYVTAVDLIGMESEPSNYSEAIPVDKTPPRMPEGVIAKPTDDRIIIGWRMNLELDLSHYNLYRSESLLDEFKRVNKEPIPGDLPYYEDRKVKLGKPYFYKVQAVDKAGNESRLTSAVSALVEDKTPPLPPTQLKAQVKERKVILNWQQKKKEDLLGFYVYRGKSKEKFMRIVKSPVKEKVFKDGGYQNRGLLPGGRYFYGVSCVDNSYNESEKIWVEVMIPDDEPPATPVSIYARPTPDGKIEVLWQAAHSWDVAGYRVYRGEDERKPTVLAELAISTSYWLDDKVEKGKRYFYYVTAIDRAGNESKPTDKFYVTSTDITPPPAPTNLRAVFYKEEGVRLSWDRVEADDLAGYRIYKAKILSGVYQLLNLEKLVKEAEFWDKEGKENLYYKVTAVDTSGNESRRSEPIRPRETEE
ncbi:MAG: hypothetical protein ACTSYT_02275 [Candidatus Asgardarchaeia archaeon]